MKIVGIIPARFESSRFPGKPLADINGKSMIQRVYRQASASTRLQQVFIATDDLRIADHAKSFTENVILTSKEHPSGTDRCFEAYKKIGVDFDFVINIQGDEPFIQPEQIDLLAMSLGNEVELATLIKKISRSEDLFNPGIVKAIIGLNNYVIYFSRNPIPYIRNVAREDWINQAEFFKHIGMYAYRTDILKKITSLPPSKLELAESLEQLRWLENGYKIKASETQLETSGIDTPEDLQRILNESIQSK